MSTYRLKQLWINPCTHYTQITMAKKTETLIEQAEKVVEKTIKETAEVIETTAEKIGEVAQEIVNENDKPKKKKSELVEDKKAKLAKLLEKAKKLEGTVEEVKDVDLKKKVKLEEDKKETLVPMEDYLKSSIHLGTRVITPDMRKYVYRRRADGLAVFNTALLDDKIRECAEFLSKFAPEEIILVCKREAGWKAAKKFAEVTGIRAFTKKYPAGILTNTNLENFTEAELIVICDPWLDKNALQDANRIKVPVMSICDTNNLTNGVTQVLPGNNKSNKSLGMILYLLTKLYIEKRKLEVTVPPIQEFVEGWDALTPPK
ncbi:MAG: 30S ribosomal protein S2 [Nanoarchaeota archaeon]